KIPLIATNKLTIEKGFFAGTETERQQTLLSAAKNGFEYVDVDLLSLKLNETIGKLKPLGAKLLVSFHKFDGVLSVSEMEQIQKQEMACGATVCKIVTTAEKIEDNIAVLNFVSANSGKSKIVCFCMGEQGKVSRLLSPLFGAFFTFASLEQGSETASGQISIQELRATFKFLENK